MIKTPTKFIALLSVAAFLMSSAFAQGVTTAPVGYVTQTATDGDDVLVHPQMLPGSSLVGSPTDITAGVLTLGSGLVDDELVVAAHYVLFTSGALSGEWFQVTANSATTVEVAEDLVALGALDSDAVSVVPFWTLDTLFPGGEGFPASSSVIAPVALVLLNDVTSVGTNLSAGSAYFYHDGAQIAAGWYLNGDFSGTKEVLISPETYFTIRNNSGVDSAFVVTGNAPVDELATKVGRLAASAQDNQLVNPYPAPLSLADSQLFESGAVTASSSVIAPVDLVLIYENSDGSGTNVSTSRSYFYHDGSQIAAGWYANGDFSGTKDTDTIPAGGAFIVRKASGAAGTVIWSPTVPYAASL